MDQGTDTLRAQVIELLSRRQPSPIELPIVVPDALAHGVLRWGYAFSQHHFLLHVRRDVVVAWNATARPSAGAPRERGPLPFEQSVTAWLGSITEEELACVAPERPMAFVERAPIPECTFAGFAVVHPTAADYRITKGDDALLPPRTYLVFPCHRSEVAREMDPTWARVQKAHLGWSDLDRAPGPAVRAVRYARPKKASAKRKERLPIRSRDARGYVSALRPDGDWVEIENWDRRVLRFADGAASLLPDGPLRAVAGRADAEALLDAFLAGDPIA